MPWNFPKQKTPLKFINNQLWQVWSHTMLGFEYVPNLSPVNKGIPLVSLKRSIMLQVFCLSWGSSMAGKLIPQSNNLKLQIIRCHLMTPTYTHTNDTRISYWYLYKPTNISQDWSTKKEITIQYQVRELST